jgi:hypothetical protein
MPYLYELIQQKVIDWRRQGYPAEEYPASRRRRVPPQLP